MRGRDDSTDLGRHRDLLLGQNETATRSTLYGAATLEFAASGQFSVDLPVGRYTVAGQSPQFEGRVCDCHSARSGHSLQDATSGKEVEGLSK
jgi:hypothetical protein